MRRDPSWRVAGGSLLGSRSCSRPSAGYGVERVPLEGGGVVAANHFSGIDHPLIGGFSPRTIYFLAKAELIGVWWSATLPAALGVFGVRRGEGDRDALAARRASSHAREAGGGKPGGYAAAFGHPGRCIPGG